MAQQISSFIIRSLATLIERSVLLVGRSVLLYDGWCLLVELSGHGHPEEVEVWNGSDIYAVPVAITRTFLQRGQSPTAYFTHRRRE